MKDHSHEVKLASGRGTRTAYLLAGHGCVMLGIVGLFLPVMPTTVFLLGAAACYSRASGRFYNRLLNNRIFGPVIADWRHHRAMTVRAKATAIAFTVVGIGASVLFWVDRLWLRLILLGIAIAVSAFLLSIKTRR